MSHSIPSFTVQDALDDIDMELLQDAVQRDDLAQSVQTVRRFGEEARRETLDAAAQKGKADYRAIAHRQFQFNEMLLTLLQEVATRQRGLELELRVYGGRSHVLGRAAGEAASDLAAEPTGGLSGKIEADPDDERPEPRSEALVRRLDAIQAMMRDDALALQLEVTPNDTPVVGRFVGSLRAAIHSLVVFYGNQLAAKQTEINRVYGGALQQLLLERERDGAALAARVDTLAAEVAALRAELSAAQGPGRELPAAGDSAQP